MSIAKVLSDLDLRKEDSLSKLFEFLRIKSISTDLQYKEDCKSAADWIGNEISNLGLSVKNYAIGDHPIVFGAPPNPNKSKPTYLFYGHYDVQPPDPIELWEFNPFEPRILNRSGKQVIHGRGSSDDKGQILTFFEACRSFLNIYKELPFNLKVLIEGEEECGSPSTSEFLKENKNLLTCDYALICDTGFEQGKPSIFTMLRGEVSLKIKIKAATTDLHSGLYGGAATNPIKALSSIINNIHDKNGRIQIPNFYDDVISLNKNQKEQWASLNFDEKKFLNDVGLSSSAGEKHYSIIENLWSRPSCEITGISGGYAGKGFKTIIPAEAFANVSFRLVKDQNPEKIKACFRNFVRNMLPNDCKVSFIEGFGTRASVVSSESKIISVAKEALIEEWGVAPILAGAGASIPIVTDLKDILGVDSLLIGFGKDEDNIHAPNEQYELESFFKGANTWARIIEKLKLN